MTSPITIGAYFWQNGVSWKSTKGLVSGIWQGFVADWSAAAQGDCQAFGRAFGGVLIAAGSVAAPYARSLPRAAPGPVRGGANPVLMGQAGERAAGITGPKGPVGPGMSTKSGYRIPDAINREAKELTEVKNVQRLSYTQQLKDYMNWCNQNGYTFVLIVRQGTKLSKQLENLVRQGKIDLRRILP